MSARRRTVIGWVATGVVLVLVGRFVWRRWDAVAAVDLDLDPGLLAISVVVLSLYLVGRALLWDDLARRSGAGIPRAEGVAAWFVSQLGKYVPGKVFLYVGRVWLYAERGRSKSRVSAAFAVETAATVVAYATAGLLALAVLDAPLLERHREWILAALAAVAILAWPRALEGATNASLRLLGRPPVELPLTGPDAARFIALYLLNWGVFGIAFFVFVRAIHPTPVGDGLYLLGAFSLAALAGMASVFAPSGLGVREGALMLLLAPVLPVGVAIVVALASRLWFTGTELVGIGIARLVMARGDASSTRVAEGGAP